MTNIKSSKDVGKMFRWSVVGNSIFEPETGKWIAFNVGRNAKYIVDLRDKHITSVILEKEKQDKKFKKKWNTNNGSYL